mgnify:FL=1
MATSNFYLWNSPNYLKKETSGVSINSGMYDQYLGRGAAVSVGQVLSNTSGYMHIASLDMIEVYIRIMSKTEQTNPNSSTYHRYTAQAISVDANLGTVLLVQPLALYDRYNSPSDTRNNTDDVAHAIYLGWQLRNADSWDISNVSSSELQTYRIGFYGQYYPIQFTYSGVNYDGYSGQGFNNEIQLDLRTIANRLGVTLETLTNGMQDASGVPSDWDYAENGEPYSGTDKGGNYKDYTSEDVANPDTPSTSISGTGFINVYAIGSNGLEAFGSELFPDITLSTPTTPAESLTSIAENINILANNFIPLFKSYINQTLINYVLDCHVVPYPPANPTSQIEHVKVAWKEFTATADKQSTDYSEVDCGSLAIPEKYKSFMDYLTRIKLYLPFIGFVDIQPTYCMGGALHVKYLCNIIDGSCMATVRATNGHGLESATVVGQYSGNCIIHTPITGVAYGSVVSGLASAVTQGVSGSFVGALGSAVNAMTQLPSSPSSNGYSASSGFLGCRTPFLLIETAVAQYPKKYMKLRGKPSNLYSRCDKLKGFTEAKSSRCLNPAGLTSEELDATIGALGEGCIFPE